ncbi:phage/plasmid-associated DNA primase [Streptomyces sp. SPB4]|nr:phage/plasmid-associated DNA primase [Streptomyces sp. SPB4]
MTDFLHLMLGYSITGDVGAQVMPFLFGSGKNGKSVLLDVLMKLLGDYADAAPPGFLMARTFEGHPTELAELHGRRVIVCSEVKPGDNLADILVTEEGPGILAWLIDGARRYLAGETDLTGPAPVRIATTAYAETEDHTGRFFEESCTLTCTFMQRLTSRQCEDFLTTCRIKALSRGALPTPTTALACIVAITASLGSWTRSGWRSTTSVSPRGRDRQPPPLPHSLR